MQMNLNLVIEFDDEWVKYFESAIFEGGYIDYWGLPSRDSERNIVIYDCGRDEDWGDEEPQDSEARKRNTYVLPKDWIAQGLKFLAERKDEHGNPRPYRRLHELLAGDYDAESLDVLVQAAIFKDLVYA